jgi:hypothetical protein
MLMIDISVIPLKRHVRQHGPAHALLYVQSAAACEQRLDARARAHGMTLQNVCREIDHLSMMEGGNSQQTPRPVPGLSVHV